MGGKSIFRRLAPAMAALWLLALLMASMVQAPMLRSAPGSPSTDRFSLSWSSGGALQTQTLGDINNDGQIDLIGLANRSIRLYYNQGGSFGIYPNWIVESASDKERLALADYDNDGDLDLAVLCYFSPIEIYRNDDGMLSTEPVWTSSPGYKIPQATTLAWGDVDGDGRLDLVTGATYFMYGAMPLTLYHNDGDDAEGAPLFNPSWTSEISEHIAGLAWGDVDSDGDLDLAVLTRTGIKLYMNVDGSLSRSAIMVTGDNQEYGALAWADADGDGDLDLAATTDWQARLYRNDQGTLTATSVWSPLEPGVVASVAWADADGDGWLDLAVGVRDGATRVYHNSQGTLNTSAVWTAPLIEDTTSLSWGDIDGDGALDLVVGNNRQPARLYTSMQPMLSAAPVWSTSATFATRGLAWGDLNGDGNLDLAAGGDPYSQRLFFYLNQAGQLQPSADWAPSDARLRVAWGDVDGDGDLDLASAGKVYHNDLGALGGEPAWESPVTNTVELSAWGDVDGDGRLDLVTGTSCAYYLGPCEPIRIYHNQGGSLSAQATWSSLEPDSTASLAWGDVDGDGDLDLAVGSYCPEVERNRRPNCRSLRIYRNSHGTLDRAPSQEWQDRHFITSLAWGDVDGDGDLDLAAGNLDEPSHLYRNDGGLLSAGPTWASLEADENNDLAWGDYDNDGDLDLAVSNANTTARVYRNERGALMPNAIWSSRQASPQTTSVAWGDYDNDGDLDLAVGETPNALKIYRNLRDRQPGPHAPPTISLEHPGVTANASFYADPAILAGPTIPIFYTLSDPAGRPVRQVVGQYSLNGGASWLPAIPTADTPTDNLSTLVTTTTRTYSETTPLALPDLTTVSSTLQLTETERIAELTLTLNLSHTLASDLRIELRPPLGQPLLLASHRGDGGAGSVTFDDQAATSVLSATAPLAGRYRPEQALARLSGSRMAGSWTLAIADEGAGGAGTLASWSMTITTRSGGVYRYTWDLEASGLVGQSDNVVFRLTAIPAIVQQANATPPPALYGAYASSTFPFRVRGTQIQVLAADGAPAASALVYRIPAGQGVDGGPLADQAGTPFQTNEQGLLEGRTLLQPGDQLLALVPISTTNAYTLYHTNGTPTTLGLDALTVGEPGTQRITVSAEHPLYLFNLAVALEWDAHQDGSYLDQLAANLRRVSRYLYDFTDGQAALGHVDVFQNADNWALADVQIHASNALRPFAAEGGVVITPTLDPLWPAIRYDTGQVHIGATWNRYGIPGQNLGDDWALVLAHELGHYLFYLDDTYLGLTSTGLLQAVSTCTGSAMGDVYLPSNTELIFDPEHWQERCAATLAAQALGRTEWETLRVWYPALITPTLGLENPGPALMPYNLTSVTINPPLTPTLGLEDQIFNVDYANNEVSSTEARAFLERGSATPEQADDYVIDLGSPLGGQNRVAAPGARLGDRLCVFDRPLQQFGCATIEPGNNRLALRKDAAWSPIIQITPLTTTTMQLQVEDLPEGLELRARVFPEYGPGGTADTLAYGAGAYSATMALDAPALVGHIQLWVEEPASPGAPRREVMLAFIMGGNPGFMRGGGGFMRGGGGFMRGGGGFMRGGAGPLISPDGHMTFITQWALATGQLYMLQDIAATPPLPSGKVLIGQGYSLIASPNTRALTGTVSFEYRGNDLLLAGANESELRIHYWDGARWQVLPTLLDTTYNLASAHGPGPGIYALFAGVAIPSIDAVAPAAATNDLTTTLVITGGYFLQPVSVTMLGPDGSLGLPLQSVSPLAITAVITQGLQPGLYSIQVASGDGGQATLAEAFALSAPAAACFYDFFESGTGKWTRSGEWGLAQLPDGARVMSDSPQGNYQSAGPAQPTRMTSITSQPFSLDGCAGPLLTFRHDYVFASGSGYQDRGRVTISRDDGATWETLAVYTGGRGYAASGKALDEPLEWGDLEWKSASIDLGGYSGTVLLRFSLETDQHGADWGWVLDEVLVRPAPWRLYLPLIT